ncbi:hydrogen gas-evolving membrane-bound hydrogenase subunit E [Thermodesulfobacteriota bacterium]
MDRLNRFAFIIPLGFTLWLVSFLPKNLHGETYALSWPWIPALGINFSFFLDGLGFLFALVISFIGFFVTLYAVDYLKHHPHATRFFSFLSLFTISMLGLVLADNLIVLFIFWELTSLTSYLLIGFDHETEEARNSARMALLVTGAGGLALLVAFLLMGMVAGTFELSEILTKGDIFRNHRLYPPILVLVLFGAFTKSAQFPFHFWLPRAMAAPTPVSAFLHSAAMVKAGIYLLARLHPVLGGTPAWMNTLMLVGAVTAVLGSLAALRQTDLKLILAYSTVTALGLLTMFLGSQSTPALVAALTFFLVHSLYKSALFLAAGTIDHETGTRQIGLLGGLLKPMPITAMAAAAAGLSMAGFPLFFGFIGKEIMYEGALLHEVSPHFAVGTALISNACMTAVCGVAAIRPFLGKPGNTPRKPHEGPFGMWCGPLVLGGLCLLFGIIPWWVAKWLVQPAVRAFQPDSGPFQQVLFHGINEPLLLSILTLILGVVLYRLVCHIWIWLGVVENYLPIKAVWTYDFSMLAIKKLANALTRQIQNGSLTQYIFIVLLAFTSGVGATLMIKQVDVWQFAFSGMHYREWAVVVIVAAGTLAAGVTRSRLTAVCSLGVCGAGCALIFLMYGAPDLALTQLLVETLTVIIISIILLRLPGLHPFSAPSYLRRFLNGLLATAAGLIVTALVLGVTQHPLDRAVTTFFEKNSLVSAHGRNIVNVILVDFRALDTLGEITVVAVAGFAVYTLIKTTCEFQEK